MPIRSRFDDPHLIVNMEPTGHITVITFGMRGGLVRTGAIMALAVVATNAVAGQPKRVVEIPKTATPPAMDGDLTSPTGAAEKGPSITSCSATRTCCGLNSVCNSNSCSRFSSVSPIPGHPFQTCPRKTRIMGPADVEDPGSAKRIGAIVPPVACRGTYDSPPWGRNPCRALVGVGRRPAEWT